MALISEDPAPSPSGLPSGWSIYGPILSGVVRAVLAALGGFGLAWAQNVSGSQIEMSVSAILMIAAAGWSIWQKIQAHRVAMRQAAVAAVASAEATAASGSPVVVLPPNN